MSPSYRLVPFGANAPAPVEDVIQLHQTLLPTSPLALLGGRFMEQYYYKLLPCEGLIFGVVAYVDDRPAGFIVATDNSTGFMRSALGRHWLYLVWVMGISVLLEPKRLGAIWEAWQIMRNRHPVPTSEQEGELLSLGVLPAYRAPRFIKQSGLEISKDLLECAIAQLKEQGISVIRAVVDADNTSAKLFYHGLGWNLDRSSVPGWRIPSVEFVWRP